MFGPTLAVVALALPLTVIGSPPDAVFGTFSRNLAGASSFVQTGSNVAVYGLYAGLKRNTSYFTVVYGNGNCDPAQAFPVGPFVTDKLGRAALAASVALPAVVDLGLTGSVSVRRGDTNADLDGDGLTGPTDVVAVPGTPSIGLVECDRSPRAYNGS